MGTGRRIVVILLGALATLLFLFVATLFIVSSTDWGREQMRRLALDQIRAAVNGEVEIARVEGHLLEGVRLIDVSIVDSAGRPFIRADTISTSYSLRALLSKRIRLSDIKFINAEVVLDRPPGEDWNFAGIFRSDEESESAPSAWGEWVELRDILLVDSRITMRTEWEPPPDLTPAEKQEAIRSALSGEIRDNVIEVPGGYQNVMEFSELNALFSRILIAHPDTAALPVDVERFSGIARPFHPPAARVRDLSGNFRLQGDTLYFHNVDARLPDSRLAGDGFYALQHADLRLRLDGTPVALNDLRWLNPALPEKGGGALELDLRLRPDSRRIVARDMDLQIGDSELRGRIDLHLGDSIRIQNTDLRFARLDTRLIERLAPDVAIPRHGRLGGSLEVEGRPEDMQIDADVTFDDYAGGTSRVTAVGRLGAEENVRFRGLQVRMQPLQTDLVRAFAPNLPVSGGTIEGTAHLTGTLEERIQVESDIRVRDPRSGVSRVLATGGVRFGETPALDDMRLRFDPLRLDLLRTANADLPPGAVVSGPLRLNGPLAGLLHVDGDLTIDDPASGVSRIAARGGIDLQDQVRMRDLTVDLNPLQTGLIRSVAPDFELGGVLQGTATINGSPSSRLTFVADVVHVEEGDRSRVAGGGTVALAGEMSLDVDLRLDPLSLYSVGQFAPQAGLRGYAEGDLSVEGSTRNFQFDADLRFGEGGALNAAGRIDLESEDAVYDVRLFAAGFNPSAISERAPVTTSLEGTARMEGRGVDPSTMQAELIADFSGVEVDGYEADEIHLDVEIAEGMATVAPSYVRMRTAEAQVEGTFGLVAGREGTLAYRVRVDSLNMFAPWIPAADTGVVAPRPAVREAAAAASEQAARDAEVEYLATGSFSEPERDSLAVLVLPRDSLAGSLDASGALRGNVEQFDAEGSAVVERFVYQGNYVEQGDLDYVLVDVGREDLDVSVDASFESLLVGGYAFNSATIDAVYRGGRYGAGQVDITVERDETTDFRLDSEFALSLERNELHLTDMSVRLDTVLWSTTGSPAVYWGGVGVRVENFELRNAETGRIYVDGDLPVDGPADLELVVSGLDIRHVTDLLQDDREAAGQFSLDARVQGTLQNPRIEGDATLIDASFEGERVPDIRADFDYAEEEFRADARFVNDSLEIATAEARIPVNLAFGDGGPRLLERPMQIDIRADRLPLHALPAFTEQVDAVEGTIAANVSITGTPLEPTMEGDISLALASLGFAPLGVRYEPLVGHARLSDNVLRIDSLVAYSDGPTRITGEVRLESIANPVFDLQVEAREAWVIDSDDARLQVDADLTIQGPLDAVEIAGLVRTRRGVIYVPEMSEFGPAEVVDLDDPSTSDRLDSLLLAQRDAVAAPSPILQNVGANLEIEIDRDVWLRSTEANVEIYTPSDVGPLRIGMRGLQGIPSIEGTINTDRGEYEYLSRRFTLTRGAVSFLGGEELDPLLQLAAEHEVRIPGREALTIRIIVGGTLRNLQITLESNAQPPISQTDLLSFLAFGREASTLIQGHGSSISGQASGGGGLVGNVAGVATQQFTAIALESMLSGLEADIGRDLGLDVIRITPANLSADVFTGSYLDVLRGTEIEAGRYVGSRLFVAAQARPVRALPGMRFEYRTRRDFEWSATWRSRYLPSEPTLRDPEVIRTGVFGSFLFKEWRF